ncbi:hypothetical protein QR680_018937 [Steinernema hermaphroditum]|uniref:RNA polymerase-associated protein CTR9 homolog n=1 Tax=Steinernema hermaphroditum TaxID=289476 RepID=A0AA39HKG6_9BILA|nr:hypothetical protein QR680_018937 [Steinernema hermaphroditum]
MAFLGSYSVPLRSGRDESLEIPLDRLPSCDDIIDILRREKCPLHVWVDLAVHYYTAGEVNTFIRLLEICDGGASQDYRDLEKDQMRALDTLAAYYVQAGSNTRDKAKRKELFTEATVLYTTADKISMYDQNHLLGRAYFCLVEGNKVDQADTQFNFVINQASHSIPAMLGKACIAFQKKDYKSALFFYRKAIKLKPDCPADVRVGIGYCLYRLGKHEKARMAFERALELDSTCIPALIGIAIIDQNTLTREALHSSIGYMSMAYRLDSENPMVLNHLANHLFYKNELSKVEHLAKIAFRNSPNDAMRAESCYQLARCFHSQGDFDKAFGAISCFEKMLKAFPNNYETLKIIGSLYAHHPSPKPGENEQRRAKAIECLKKVVYLTPEDIEAYIDLAQLQEQNDPNASLASYTKVCELLTSQTEMEVPRAIFNNMASLHYSKGNYNEAKELFEKAKIVLTRHVQKEPNDANIRSLLLTVNYNVGRVSEMLCLFTEAEEIYKAILHENDNYTDCLMRLGCIARDKGHIYNASVFFKETMGINQTNPDSWTLIGNLHMAKNEFDPAQKMFEQILRICKDDAYSFVALGNVRLETLFSVNRNRENDKKNRDRALMFYTKALKLQPGNIWAANGIACVLAQKGNFAEARDIFAQVRESTTNFLDVWMNLAHIYMENGQFVSAIQFYTNCMNKFGKQNDAQMLMYLARAYFKANKLKECRECLERALCEAPDNLQITFNLANVLQKLSMQVLQDSKSSLEAVFGAVDDLKSAEQMFLFIANNRDESLINARYVSHTVCQSEAGACSDLLKQAPIYVQRAKTQDEEEQRQRCIQEEERLALRRQQEEETRLKQEREREQLESLKLARQQFVEKTKEFLKLPQVVEEKKSRDGGGGRRCRADHDEFVNDSTDMGDWQNEEGGEERPRKQRNKGDKKASRRRRDKERGAAEGNDEGDDDNRREKRSHGKGSSRRKPEKQEQQKNDGKFKSRAYLSSESDSDVDIPVTQPNYDESDSDTHEETKRNLAETAKSYSDDDVSRENLSEPKRVQLSSDSEDNGSVKEPKTSSSSEPLSD